MMPCASLSLRPRPCRDPQCGLCWGLGSLRTIGQSGHHHGGFSGESFMASVSLLPRSSGHLALGLLPSWGLKEPLVAQP